MLPTLRSGAAGIQNLREEAIETGNVMSTETAQAAAEVNDQFNEMQHIAAGVGLALGTKIVPILGDVLVVAKELAGAIGLVDTNLEALANRASISDDAINELVESLYDGPTGLTRALIDGMDHLQDFSAAIVGDLVTNTKTATEALEDKIEALLGTEAGVDAVRQAIEGHDATLILLLQTLSLEEIQALATAEALGKEETATDGVTAAVGGLSAAVQTSRKEMQTEFDLITMALGEVKGAFDGAANAAASANLTMSLFDTEKARAELLAAAVAAQVNQAAMRGDDPFIAGQEAFDALIGTQANLDKLTSAAAILGIFGGAGTVTGQTVTSPTSSGSSSSKAKPEVDQLELYNIALSMRCRTESDVAAGATDAQIEMLRSAFDEDFFASSIRASRSSTDADRVPLALRPDPAIHQGRPGCGYEACRSAGQV